MTPPLIMLAAMGVMYAAGVYLMLDRSLTRVLLGFMLVGNATNVLLLLTAGEPGGPPLTDGEDLSTEGMLDPLPQALILTAIVITFSITAFLLAMIYRSWRFVRDESLQDDLEDLRVAVEPSRASRDEAGTSGEYDDTEFGDEATDPVEEHPPDLDDDSTPEAREAMREAPSEGSEEPEAAQAESAQAEPAPGAEHRTGSGRTGDDQTGSDQPGGEDEGMGSEGGRA